MLKEIICDKFKQKRVEFHRGLNVVLGDDQGSNSIGKSTFLMIIDFVYGGKDYITKSEDIQENVGIHTIKFCFVFDEKYYYFSRDTVNTETVNICDSNYNIQDNISVDDYTRKLRRLYCFNNKDVSFRNAVGRYARVYGKDNLNEKRPLDLVRNERAEQTINSLLQLFGLYGQIKELDELVKSKKDELKALTEAQKYNFVSKIGATERRSNDKKLEELEKEKKKLTKELSEGLLDLDSEKTELILELKREFSTYNKETKRLKAKRNSLSDNLAGVKTITKKDIEQIQKFFPEVDLVQIQKIENFHKEINRVLNQEIKDELLNIEKTMNVLEMEKDKISIKISEITNTENFSKVILFKYAEIQKEIEMRLNQNEFYDKKKLLEKEKNDAEERKEKIKKQKTNEVQEKINNKLETLNNKIYDDAKIPPTLEIDKNQYVFKTVDDTGTGASYRGMVLYDISILELTCLPILIHDSVLLKQIEDIAIEKILEIYSNSEKQVFIALDKSSSYSRRSQEILNDKRVLELGTDGNELFGKSWSKKLSTMKE